MRVHVVAGAVVAMLLSVLPTLPASAITTGPDTDDPSMISRLGADWRDQMLAGVNAMRIEAGQQPVTACTSLDVSSQAWSNYMASTGFFDHTINGETWTQRMQAAGYGFSRPWNGENLAEGQQDVASVIDYWRNSPFHHANFVDPEAVEVGFGVGLAPNGKVYWTSDLGAGGCTRAIAESKYPEAITITAEPDRPVNVGPVSVGRSTVTVKLPKGAYGTVKVFSETSTCLFPNQKGACAIVTIDLVTKGPDGKNLYSSRVPVNVPITCTRVSCPPVAKAKGRYNPVADFRAYPLVLEMKINGVYRPPLEAPPCQRLTDKRKRTGVIGTKEARARGFCLDVFAFKRTKAGLARTLLFVEDPRLLTISRG